MTYRSHARWLCCLLALASCTSRATRLDAASDASVDSAPVDTVVDGLPTSPSTTVQTIYLHTDGATARDPLLVVEPAGSARLAVAPNASATELVYLEPDGQERWRTPLGCPPELLIAAHALAVDDQGRTTIGAVVSNVTSSTPCTIANLTQPLALLDPLLLQLGSDGQPRWATPLGGGKSAPSIAELAVDASLVFAAGGFDQELRIGGITALRVAKANHWSAGFYTASGAMRWAHVIETEDGSTRLRSLTRQGGELGLLMGHTTKLTLGPLSLEAPPKCEEWLVSRSAVATLTASDGIVLALEAAAADPKGCLPQVLTMASLGVARCLAGILNSDGGLTIAGQRLDGADQRRDLFVACSEGSPAQLRWVYRAENTAGVRDQDLQLFAGADGALYLSATISRGIVRVGERTYVAADKPSSFLLFRLDPTTGTPSWSLFVPGLPRASVGVDAQGIITFAARVHEQAITLDGKRIEPTASGRLVVWRFRPLP